MEKIKIIQGNENDLEEIVSFNYHIFKKIYQTEPYSLKQYQKKINKNSLIYLAKVDDCLVGNLISFPQKDSWYLWVLGVDKKYRKQKIATKLLNLTEKYATKKGYKEVTVKVYNVSREMICLMLKRNYYLTKINTTNNDPNYHFVFLKKDLKKIK